MTAIFMALTSPISNAQAITDPILLAGQEIFDNSGGFPDAGATGSCASCHGDEAQGIPGFPELDTPRGVETMINTVVERMPFGDPDACLRECAENVVAYIQTFWPEPPTPTDPILLAGQEIYDNTGGFPDAGTTGSCASCHGEDTRGIPVFLNLLRLAMYRQ